LSNRPGTKILISGNHDETHPIHGSWVSATERWLALGIFKVITPFGSVKINGHKVQLNHFPFRGEGSRDMEDRYLEWRPRNEGQLLLSGHEHKTNVLEEDIPNQFHVGLDSWNLELVHELSVGDWIDGIR
jgi:calcineurin-like phosphoesterase family protein